MWKAHSPDYDPCSHLTDISHWKENNVGVRQVAKHEECRTGMSEPTREDLSDKNVRPT